MAYETAAAVTNSKGTPYGEIDGATLSHMANSITKKLREGGSQEEQEERKFKQAAIQAILAYRSIHPQG
jgi:hypothetical protein